MDGQDGQKDRRRMDQQFDNVSTTDITRRAQKGLIRMVACLFSDVMKAHSGCKSANLHQS